MSYTFKNEAPELAPLIYVGQEELSDDSINEESGDIESRFDKDEFPFLIPILPVVN